MKKYISLFINSNTDLCRKLLFLFFPVIFSGLLISCKKFVKADEPINQLSNKVVFENEASATAAILGAYATMISNGFASGDPLSITVLGGLSADELKDYSSNPTQVQFYENNISPGNTSVKDFLWAPMYSCIYNANLAIEGLEASSNMNAGIRYHLLGEARFLRAFCHFYLNGLFGDIPLVTTSTYLINNVAGKNTKEEIYRQIITDLLEAETLLNVSYLDANNQASPERVRPTKSAASAFLARVYLYKGDFGNAEKAATTVIDNTATFHLVENLDDVFLKNSPEAIWQLQPVTPEINTNEGFNFVLTSLPNFVALSSDIYNSFEPGDKRKEFWIKDFSTVDGIYYYPFKYKIKTGSELMEYSMVFRLAEQYLVRAEARARLGNFQGSLEDINVLRARAGLEAIVFNNEAVLFDAIYKERRLELFTEWGHRWFDLKRSGHIDQVLSAVKGANWNASDTLYPIPLSEIQNNKRLTQNLGY